MIAVFSFLMGFFGEYFLFYGLAGFYIYSFGLKAQGSSCPGFFPLLHLEFGIRSRVLSRRPLSSKLISLSLFPPMKKGATSALGFWLII